MLRRRPCRGRISSSAGVASGHLWGKRASCTPFPTRPKLVTAGRAVSSSAMRALSGSFKADIGVVRICCTRFLIGPRSVPTTGVKSLYSLAKAAISWPRQCRRTSRPPETGSGHGFGPCVLRVSCDQVAGCAAPVKRADGQEGPATTAGPKLGPASPSTRSGSTPRSEFAKRTGRGSPKTSGPPFAVDHGCGVNRNSPSQAERFP